MSKREMELAHALSEASRQRDEYARQLIDKDRLCAQASQMAHELRTQLSKAIRREAYLVKSKAHLDCAVEEVLEMLSRSRDAGCGCVSIAIDAIQIVAGESSDMVCVHKDSHEMAELLDVLETLRSEMDLIKRRNAQVRELILWVSKERLVEESKDECFLKRNDTSHNCGKCDDIQCSMNLIGARLREVVRGMRGAHVVGS